MAAVSSLNSDARTQQHSAYIFFLNKLEGLHPCRHALLKKGKAKFKGYKKVYKTAPSSWAELGNKKGNKEKQ